jgi:uncharacterized membrane protein
MVAMMKTAIYVLYTIPNLMATSVEKEFNYKAATDFAANNYPIAIACVSFYLVGIFGGREVMKRYQPFNLSTSLAVWNAFLSVLSFIGMLRTMPYLGAILLERYVQQKAAFFFTVALSIKCLCF